MDTVDNQSKNYRQFWEQQERILLAPYATFAADAQRAEPGEKCTIRTEFQRDRDRITHSDAFRRLKNKTQVFLDPVNDHQRTRLTHTLEVTQIARTIARCLRLNEDLAESIGLGHDLGHTPFGHSGENVLNRLCSTGFKHAEQSVRVAQMLHLNLTKQVIDGIANHTGTDMAHTLEGKVIKYADRIAYLNHDIDDAIRVGVLQLEQLPSSALRTLGRGHSERIDTMVKAILECSAGKPVVTMRADVEEEMMKLRSFMFENVYYKVSGNIHNERAEQVITGLYNYYMEYGIPEHLTAYDAYNFSTMNAAEKDFANHHERVVVDFIAGMTDAYATRAFEKISRKTMEPLRVIKNL
ncbi:MAG: deoxyguanosinetriphosphate triphosphohydrolase [Clostridiales bacterium]|nr:deoxyguanosinetriphosphate triphosphohydrolase [Clostridiales bacterium]